MGSSTVKYYYLVDHEILLCLRPMVVQPLNLSTTFLQVRFASDDAGDDDDFGSSGDGGDLGDHGRDGPVRQQWAAAGGTGGGQTGMGGRDYYKAKLIFRAHRKNSPYRACTAFLSMHMI